VGQHAAESLVPVDRSGYESGQTPEGIQHLVGNVGEWAATRVQYTEDGNDVVPEGDWNGRTRVLGLVVMGGGWTDNANTADFATVADSSQGGGKDTGFRCVATAN